jgi:glycosyltransferase involved in cell wall biosynthesis
MPEALVSILTPTFPGREEDLKRCMTSVAHLDWPNIEHVIVSDRNPDLRRSIEASNFPTPSHGYDIRFIEIGENWRTPTAEASTGSIPWMVGSYLALGEFVAFLGDDDELLPDHVSLHIEAMRRDGTMWSVSQVQFRVDGVDQFVVGTPPYALGSVDTTGIMCRAEALAVARWDANGNNAGDHQMLHGWIDVGLAGSFIERVTGIHNDGWLANKSGRPDRPGGMR